MYQTFGKCIILLARHGCILTVKCTHYLLFSVSYMSVTAPLFLTHFLIYKSFTYEIEINTYIHTYIHTFKNVCQLNGQTKPNLLQHFEGPKSKENFCN